MPRVLFLEDEPNLADSLPEVLMDKMDKYGKWQIVGTTDISEALTRVAHEEFDVVLLDISMPPTEGMDLDEIEYGRYTGIEVARRIKRLKPDLPIVALTVVTETSLQQRIREAGVKEILNKPTEFDSIAQMLLRAVQSS